MIKRLVDGEPNQFSCFSIKSERQDLNLRPPLPQSGALPSCATPRRIQITTALCGASAEAFVAASAAGSAWR